MDDSRYGTTNKRGDFKPNKLDYPPLFSLPFRPLAILAWIFKWDGYIWPWNLVYALIGVAVWNYATPSVQAITAGGWQWIAFVLARNYGMTVAVYGSLHLWLYVKKAQGTRFKFNANWPQTSNLFISGRQTIDNLIWTLLSGVPIWTAWECLMLWLFSTGYIPFVQFSSNPIYFVALFFVIPLIGDVHFYLVHRALHWPPLYKLVHSLHHNYVNPGPWSGLSMHPVEHLAYFSSVLIHLVLPSHPLHMMFNIFGKALGPSQSHAGFDKVVLGEQAHLDSHGYQHYLHHKYFECNYADGTVPLDKWFGTFHDGTPESQKAMDERFRERNRKAKSKPATPEGTGSSGA